MSWDFTLDKYAELCRVIRGSSYEIMTLAQFLKAGRPQHFVLILRHDVDELPHCALRMAQLEASLGIKATYHVRMARFVFLPDVLVDLQKLGHEVGYHYEVLARARGDHRQAILRFAQELEQFRRIVPVETISMHGSVLTPWDNRELWRHYDFREYGLLGEAYLSIDYKNVYYFTDTGRSWGAERNNLRDRVEGRKPGRSIRTTDELMAFLSQAPNGPVVISAHPAWWAASRWEWGMWAAYNLIANLAKRMVVWQRSAFGQAGQYETCQKDGF
jgi:hypothetical protein